MFTVRCTRKLLARLGSPSPGEDVEPTTRLGDWYANLLFPPGAQLVLAISERSLLPVVVLAAPATSVVARIGHAAVQVLERLGVAASAVQAERREMEAVRIGRTASRQVLGSMNDFVYLMTGHLGREVSLLDVAVELAHTPCGPIGMKYPVDVVLQLPSITSPLVQAPSWGSASRRFPKFTPLPSAFAWENGSSQPLGLGQLAGICGEPPALQPPSSVAETARHVATRNCRNLSVRIFASTSIAQGFHQRATEPGRCSLSVLPP